MHPWYFSTNFPKNSDKKQSLELPKETSRSPYSLSTSMFMSPAYGEKLLWVIEILSLYMTNKAICSLVETFEKAYLFRECDWGRGRKHFPKSQFLFSCLLLVTCSLQTHRGAKVGENDDRIAECFSNATEMFWRFTQMLWRCQGSSPPVSCSCVHINSCGLINLVKSINRPLDWMQSFWKVSIQ